MSTTENMIVTENIGLKAPKEDAFYEVGYIAENNEIIDRKFADVGNLEDMNSEIGASTMVEALNLTFQSGNEKRGILASNLVAMGVEADASETWDILLPKVKDISTGVDTSNDTVVAEVLLEGYTAHDANQEQIVGTLPDKTGTEEYTATATLDSTNSELQMTIPAMGKYGTNNKLKATFAKIASLIGLTAAKLVKGNTILGITGNSNNMDTSVGTITSANQLLKGIIGCSDGKTYTGTVVDRRGTTVAATAVSQDDTYTYFKTPAGCYSEESMVRTENSNLAIEFTASLFYQNSDAAYEYIEIDTSKRTKLTVTKIGGSSVTKAIIYNKADNSVIGQTTTSNNSAVEIDVSSVDSVKIMMASSSTNQQLIMSIKL